MRWFALAIDIFTMANFDDPNCQFIILDRINNTISALTDTMRPLRNPAKSVHPGLIGVFSSIS